MLLLMRWRRKKKRKSCPPLPLIGFDCPDDFFFAVEMAANSIQQSFHPLRSFT